MNIVVCIKQVPDVDDIKWTKENNLDRSQMLSCINPHDEYALNWAAKIKAELKDVKITALSMGPKQAGDVLNYALAKCADSAILLCDKMFAASDTLATSKVIARSIKKYIPDFDLIITGQMASDGDTAQVPVSLSELLNIDDVTNCVYIKKAEENNFSVIQRLENEIIELNIKTPCLIAIKQECDIVKKIKIDDYKRAQQSDIKEVCFNDLELSKDEVGIMGSPTTVYRAFRPEIAKNALEIKQDYKKAIFDIIGEKLNAK